LVCTVSDQVYTMENIKAFVISVIIYRERLVEDNETKEFYLLNGSRFSRRVPEKRVALKSK
jgi:hypothetical protein